MNMAMHRSVLSTNSDHSVSIGQQAVKENI